MPVLAVKGLRSGYGSIEALHGIDLEVGEQEVVAVLGPNGAGKSTLLKTISGLLRARSGEIRFGDKPISRLSPHHIVQRGVVHVPEGRRIFSDLTVEENITMGGYTVRSAGDLAEVRESCLQLFPILAERRRQPAGTLSGGEQQMLAIARALCSQPRLLMLDEPSMGLAPILVSRIYETFARIVASGVAILLVEQNARRALQASSRAYVLDQGRVALVEASQRLQGSGEIQQLYLGGHSRQKGESHV